MQEFAEDGDVDSAYGVSGDMSDTTSMASFIFKYRQQNGRTYHAYQTDGEYKSKASPISKPREIMTDMSQRISCPMTRYGVSLCEQPFVC
jgi:hypothetical protein